MICDSNDMSVGILRVNSNNTISQLKCFTASTVSLSMESYASELRLFISNLISVAIWLSTDLDVVGELTNVEAKEWYDFLVKHLMLFFRDGV